MFLSREIFFPRKAPIVANEACPYEHGGILKERSKEKSNTLERISKATGKIGCVVKTIHELAFSLRFFTRNYQECLCRI